MGTKAARLRLGCSSTMVVEKKFKRAPPDFGEERAIILPKGELELRHLRVSDNGKSAWGPYTCLW